MAVKPKAFKELYGKAAGRCAMCKGFASVFKEKVCEIELSNRNLSEAAHVIAKKKKGPRGEDGYSGNIDDYENLILLCPTHHKAVDDNPDKFSSDWLRRKKRELEQWVENNLAPDNRRLHDVNCLRMLMEVLAFTQIRGQCEDLPDSFDSNLLEVGSILDEFCVVAPDARPFFDGELESKFHDFESSYFSLIKILKSNIETSKKYFIPIYKEQVRRGHKTIIPLNKGELYGHEKSFEICDKIKAKRNQFIKHYLSLLDHLRFNYTEIGLRSR
ncbi:HNH endonuclease [Pseudomonas sp. SWRI50]|jgi:hypothetical protein|uniref:HNH endonuclease signature motif containing protein n=1 Tax=Pseudomonas sp. SWRI50 TaxID=2745484 RepID=UPI001646800B|nr:HNH endonuclease signature motif containing protein [Pseudomonas sp. SWRI50]MBC3487123.1 HNH endonuclease [Pseudomonas sp. SWRI50]